MTNTRMLQDLGYDGILFHYLVACQQASSPGPTVSGAGNGKRACNYVSEIWIPWWLPVNWAVRFLKADIITNVISTNRQHSTLTFSIFKFQRHSSRFSFLFPPHHQGAPESLLTRNILDRMSFWKWCLKHWGAKHWQCLFFFLVWKMKWIGGHEKWSNLEQGS